MSKHTQGPWNQVAAIMTDRGMVYGINAFCEVPGFSGRQDCRIVEAFSNEANAKLIAAAPDLLAALIELRDHVRDDSPDMWERVENAIAKATTNGDPRP